MGPFDLLSQTSLFETLPEEQLNSNSASQNLTAQIAGAASLRNSGGTTPNAVLTDLQNAVSESQTALDKSEEMQLRYQAAADRMMRQQRNFRELKSSTILSPQTNAAIDYAAEDALRADIDEQARVSLEREAVEQIQEKLTTDPNEARILMNRYRSKGDAVDVQRDYGVRRMLVGQALQKAQLDEDSEGWVNWFVTSALQLVPLNFNFSLLGNVKEGQGGYDPSFSRLFLPGSDLQKQAEAFNTMSTEELAVALPGIIENIRSNATTFGFTDPVKQNYLLNQLNAPTDKMMNNLWGMAEFAFIPGAPSLAKKVASVPFNLASLGARKAAAESVASAIELTAKEGGEAALRATGVSADEIVENALPTAINPLKVDGDTLVRLSGSVTRASDEAQEFVREWNLMPTTRFNSMDEFNEAVEATKLRIRERLSIDIEDFNVVENRLADGTSTFKVRATLPGFATEAEATQFLLSRGLTSEGMISLDDIVTKTVRTPQEDGFNIMAYHGTNGEFDRFSQEFSAGNTQAKDAKGAFYFSSNPDVAYTYAREAARKTDITIMPAGYDEALAEANRIDELFLKEKATFEEATAAWVKVNEIETLGKAERNFGNIRPTLIDTSNFKTVDMEGRGYSAFEHGTILDEAKAEGKDGVIFRNYDDSMAPFVHDPVEGEKFMDMTSDIYAVFDTDKSVRSAFERNVTEDISGQYFPHVEMDIAETGFYTNPLNPPEQSFLARFALNTSQTSDVRLFEKASVSGNKRNKLQKLIDKQLTSSFKALNKADRVYLEQILLKGQNMAKWFNDDEFQTIFERATGRDMPASVQKAYHQYRFNNDVEWTLRNADTYRQKVIRGFESGKFHALDTPYDVDMIVDYAPSRVPQERVYNLSDDVHYTSNEPLTESRLEVLRGQGYVMVKTEQPIKLADGVTVDRFLAKRGDVELSPLRQEQLAYSAGGHRLYANKYFVKQASKGIQPDTGKQYLNSPNVFVTAPTRADAARWADTMERARVAVASGRDAAYLDANVFQAQKGFPKGEEFISKIESGLIDKDEPFEALFDREMPSAYMTKEDISKFVDDEEVGFNGYYRTTGRMYYSSKGDHLLDYTGELAPTIDPFEAQAKALYNVANMSSFSDFKTSAIDRWVRTYKRYLNTRDLPLEELDSPARLFNSAQLNRDVPIPVRQQIEGQRESIKRILRFESDWDRGYRNFQRSTAEWIMGGGDSDMRRKLSNWWLEDRNPVGFLRGLAFDMKLGMFNFGQMAIQTSTMFSALALSPKHGFHGVGSFMPVWSYFLSKGSESVLDRLAKNGAWKLGGFVDAAEFKNYVREAHRTGFFDLGDTHVMVNDFGPQSTFGSFTGAADSIREKGRMFFYNAEVMNRLVAYRIAYGEAVDRFGRQAAGTGEFREFLAGRAENYSFNMSDQSKAWWQEGLMSIPTQFWAYNVRMMEALVGKNFTGAQKMRLAAAQMGMAGIGGIPVASAVAEFVKNKYGIETDMAEDSSNMVSTFYRGMGDRLIFELTGADVLAGEKWGTGSWSSDLVKDLFGLSEYKQKTTAETLGGATYSIVSTAAGTVLGAAGPLVDYWTNHEAGSAQWELGEDKLLEMASQISTIGNASKALALYNYGIYRSTKGSVLADSLPPQDAFAVALGFRPGELDEVATMMAVNQDRQETVDEYAKVIRNYRQEAFTVPDKFQENAQKVNAFMQMIPVEMRRDVLRRVNEVTDPSLYSSLTRKKNQEELGRHIAEEANGEAN